MSSGVSTRDSLLLTRYYQAIDPRVTKVKADVAKVVLMADIYHLLSYSDIKTRLAAESILCNKVLTVTQKLSAIQTLEPPRPYAFVRELHALIKINAKLVRSHKQEEEVQQQKLQHKAAVRLYQIGRTPRPSPLSDRNESKEEKRWPNTVSAPPPSTTSARPPATKCIESTAHIPKHQSKPLSRASSANDDDSDSWMYFFQFLTFAAMVASQASE